MPRGGVARKRAPKLVLDVVEGGGVVAADADVGKDFGQAPGRKGGAGVIRPCDDQGGFAAEGVGHDFDEPLARCEVARRDLAAVGKLGDERVVAAGEDRRGLARRGLDFVGAADQGDGESGGLEAHAGGQVRDALGAVTGHDDHIDPVGDVAPGEEAVGRVDVGEVEVVLRASPAAGDGAGAGGRGQCGDDDPAPAGANGERGEVREAQVGRIGSGGGVADAVPRQELEAVERFGRERCGIVGAEVGVEREIGDEVDAGSAVVQGGPGEGDAGRGSRRVAGADPGGEIVGHVAE